MAKIFAVSGALAMLAGCGVSELFGPVDTGGVAGSGIGGHSGSTGGRTSGNENTVGGFSTGSIGGVGSIGGNTNGPGGSSTGRINGTVGGNTVGGNTGTVGGNATNGGNGTTGRPTNGSGPGTGGRSSGGKTSGGNATGGNTTGGGNCLGLYADCDTDAGCGCGNTCVFDQVLDRDVCEETCSKKDPCTRPETLCNGTNCALIPCGPGTGNGNFDGACSADGTAGDKDGTCVPFAGADGGAACSLAGTADGTCDPDATRSQTTSLCPVGSYCYPALTKPGNVCYTLCLPGFGNGGNATCQAEGFTGCFPLNPPLGICF